MPGTPRKNYYKTPPQERFWACVTKTEDCWEWHGPQDHGYGIVSVTDPDSTTRYKNIRANRFSWELHNGPIPDGLCVCHRCDNPPCCNPDHLFLGTDEDNAHDMWNKGRGVKLSPSIGVKNVNAKLKDEDIPKIRALLADHSMTQNEIAEVFHVTKKVIWQIRHRKTWTHVP